MSHLERYLKKRKKKTAVGERLGTKNPIPTPVSLKSFSENSACGDLKRCHRFFMPQILMRAFTAAEGRFRWKSWPFSRSDISWDWKKKQSVPSSGRDGRIIRKVISTTAISSFWTKKCTGGDKGHTITPMAGEESHICPLWAQKKFYTDQKRTETSIIKPDRVQLRLL